MANYYGNGRSNYIHVTDLSKVKKLASVYSLQVIENQKDPSMIAFLAISEDGDIDYYANPDTDEETFEELFSPEEAKAIIENEELPLFMETIAEYMLDGEVFIWQHAGYEGNRYVNGYAVAINNKNETARVGLDDISEKAKKLGNLITDPSY
jgi:hypothetical protein